ncbi:MAG: family 20 glycosylhydrolase, partial [Thermoguttaceae bacterium]
MRAEGLKTEAELQSYFTRRIERFINSKGRRLIGWDEIMNGGLTPSASVMSWRNMLSGQKAARSGHDVVMSPTAYCYFDYPQAEGERGLGKRVLSLEKVYSFNPMPAGLEKEYRRHLLGAQGNVWSELILTFRGVEYMAYPRAVALSEVVWSPPEGRSFDEFRARLEQHLKRLDQLNVNYRHLDPPVSK